MEIEEQNKWKKKEKEREGERGRDNYKGTHNDYWGCRIK